LAARTIIREETTTITNVDTNNFCLNNVFLYIKKKFEGILYNS
jgi:hypothetical protein